MFDISWFDEGGPVETAQFWLWSISAVVALAMSHRPRDARIRALLRTLGMLAVLAAAREQDLHIWLNPETFGQYGVRYRMDWWLDANVPLGLKAGWLAGFATIGGGLYLVARKAAPLVKEMINARAPAALMLAAAVVSLLIGYVLDDLMRGVFSDWRHALEETAELIGPIFYLWAVITLVVKTDDLIDSGVRHP